MTDLPVENPGDELPVAWALGTIVAMVAVLLCAPMIRGYWWASHDTLHYPLRQAEYLQILKNGVWYPRWCPDFYRQYGAPFFNFYPPMVYAVTALLIALFGVDPVEGLKLFVVVASIIGGLGMFGLVRQETRRLDAAFFGALMFLFMPYRFTDVYARGDLAEFSALSVLPFALWMYRAMACAPARRLARLGFAAALAHGALLLTHTIIGQWGTELIAVLMIVTLVPVWRSGDRARVLAVAIAFAAGLGLSAIYTLPALLERSLVHIDWMTVGKADTVSNIIPLAFLLRPGFFHVGEPLLIGFAFLGAGLLWPRTRRAVSRTLIWWIPVGVSAFMVLPPSAGIWPLVPLGKFIQFPWRLLAFVVVCGSVGLGTLWAAFVPQLAQRRWLLLALVCTWVGVYAPRNFTVGYFHSHDNFPGPADDSDATTVNHEYLPMDAATAPTAPRGRIAVPADGTVQVVSSQPLGSGFRLQLDAVTPGTVDVQHHWFAGWRARTASGAPIAAGPSPVGLIRLQLPEPGHYDVLLEFGTTAPRLIGTLMTFTALLFLYPALLLLGRSRSAALLPRST